MYVVYLKKMTHQFTEQKITQKTIFFAQSKIFHYLCSRNDSRWGMWAGVSAFHPNKNLSKI